MRIFCKQHNHTVTMPSRKLPEVGARYGNWTFLGEYNGRKWHCRCNCGNDYWPNSCHLKSGDSRACRSCSNKTHGFNTRNSKLYAIWVGIKTRCLNTKHSTYPGYGGRGITICPEWRNDFLVFARDVGEFPGGAYTIERIDNNRGYEPGNTCWKLPYAQARNRRDNRWLTIYGKTMCVTDWCRQTGISSPCAYYRVRKLGWSWEAAVTTPSTK